MNQQIIDRLRALEVENKSRRLQNGSRQEKDYVMVQREDSPPPYSSGVTQPMGHDVSVSQTESWQHELLREPKNQLALCAFTNNVSNT